MTVTLETLLLAIACVFMAVEIGMLKSKLREVDDSVQGVWNDLDEAWEANDALAQGFVSAGQQFDAVYERLMDAEESINKAHEGIQYLAKGDSL